MRLPSLFVGLGRAAASLILAALPAACGDDSNGDDAPTADASVASPVYVVSSTVYDESTSSYVSVLGSLDAQEIDYDQAREFSGGADLWVYDGFVFVADAESQKITKFSVEEGELVEQAAVSFLDYGPTEFGFWRNVFVSSTKAYFLNGSTEYILWNPRDMLITGTLAIPALEERDGLSGYPGYMDRAAVVRDGRLYQSFYWTDLQSFFRFTPDSRIAVIDVEKDEFVEYLEAPCPGLDYASADAAGNVFFSSWIFAPGGAAVLEQPATCAVELGVDGSVSTAFTVGDIAGGREGAALHFQPNGTAFLSVLHAERVEIGPMTDPATVAYADNWRFWTYNPADGTAAQVDAIDWNGGAQYTYEIDGRTLMLVSEADYSATTIYDVSDVSAPAALFDTRGWSTRLFKVR